MNIRSATPSDATEIAALIRSHESVVVVDPSAAAPFWESMSESAHAMNLASDRYRYFVADSEGVLVGYIAMRDATHLFNLFVSRPWQRRGVGRALWQHVLDVHLSVLPRRIVTVNVSVNALPAYRALGFSEAGEEVRVHGLAFVPMRWGKSPDVA